MLQAASFEQHSNHTLLGGIHSSLVNLKSDGQKTKGCMARDFGDQRDGWSTGVILGP